MILELFYIIFNTIFVIFNDLAIHIFIIYGLSLRVVFCWRRYLNMEKKNTVYGDKIQYFFCGI